MDYVAMEFGKAMEVGKIGAALTTGCRAKGWWPRADMPDAN